jgi:hypothetical protein
LKTRKFLRPATIKKFKAKKKKMNTDATTINEVYLTPDELVTRYRGQVNKRTLANWRSHRDGPKYTKIGGRVLYRLDNVVEWENKRTLKS